MSIDKIDYVAMGGRIRQLRKEHNITQAQLAARLEISPAFMGHIERGTRVPSLETLARIAGELGVSLDRVVLGVEPDTEYLRINLSDNPGEKMQMLNDVMRVLDDRKDDWFTPGS